MAQPTPQRALSRDARSALRRRAHFEMAWRELYWFVRLFWSVVEPERDLVPSWHLELICRKLEAVTRGEIKRLVICVPPGSMKTLLVGVMWQAWQMMHRPSLRTICVSHTVRLAVEASDKTRTIVSSALYRRLLQYGISTGRSPWAEFTEGEPWRVRHDKSAVANWANTLEGKRQAIGIRASITGMRGDQLVVDDPYDAQEAVRHSVRTQSRMMKGVIDTFDGVLDSRLNDPKTSARVVIMQRLHQEDLAGELLTRPEWTDAELGGHAIVLPMECDPGHAHIHPEDPRTEPGQLLMPQRWGPDEVALMRKRWGRHWHAQGQQAPRPAGGKRFKRGMFKRYSAAPEAMARLCGRLAITIDCAASDNEGADQTSMQVWGQMGRKRVLLDSVGGQWRSPRQEIELKALWNRWSPFGVSEVICEEASNGFALIDYGLGEGLPMVPFRPAQFGGKEARAAYTEGAGEAGLIYIPEDDHPQCAWVGAWLDEHLDFPSKPNDKVDAASQLHCRWTQKQRVGLDATNRKLGWLEGV